MTTLATAPGHSRLEGLLRRGIVPLLLSVAGGLLAGFAFNQVLDRAIAGRTEASAFALLARVGPDLEGVLASGQDAREAIRRLGRQLSLRATLIAADGRVLGDSSVVPERIGSLENHANRPEVLEATRSGRGVRTRFSSTVGDRLVYAAVRLRGGEVLRLAFPEKDLARWETPFRRQTLGLSILAGLLVAVLLIRARSSHAAELVLVRQAVAGAERGERPANPGPVTEETAVVFSALGNLADVTSERAAEARRAAGVSRIVFDEVPVGLLVVDPTLSLLDANPEAIRILGAGSGPLRPGEHVLELVREKALTGLLEAALQEGRASGLLTLPAERGGRTLEASAVRVAPGARPGLPAVVAILRETPSLRRS
ncbi:MAG: PAS domain-containing protein [Holophagales bacterium]|nr:PAS domain-containing protein [Holophagales bacterium]